MTHGQLVRMPRRLGPRSRADHGLRYRVRTDDLTRQQYLWDGVDLGAAKRRMAVPAAAVDQRMQNARLRVRDQRTTARRRS